MLHKNVIEEFKEAREQFVSPYFLVKKADGIYRFIFNLKSLNKFIDPVHFKMKDIHTAKNLMTKGSLELKDAYYLILIRDNRKFLRLKFFNKIYQFTNLPFRLCTSLYVFMKLMKPIINQLRLQGITSVIYLDDILFINKSKEICQNNIDYVIDLLEHLSFIIDY